LETTLADKKPNDALVKLQKAEDAKKATAEYRAAAAAVDANTARLRAQRLEREAAAADAVPAAKPVKKAAKKAKAAAGKLSDWLQDQKKSGRNS
jgi:predicted membrane chloride channel (bestrophin family)